MLSGSFEAKPFTPGKKPLNHKRALRVAVIYAVLGGAWIVLSDLFLEFVVREHADLLVYQSVKGLLFILATSVIVYGLACRVSQTAENEASETRLKDIENLLTTLLANLGDVVLIIDPDTRTIVTCNEAVEHLFGYSSDELIGQNSAILHVDRESYQNFGTISESMLEKKGIFRTNYRMKKKDGTIIDTENTVVSLDNKHDWQKGVISIIHDITGEVRTRQALQVSEEKHRLLAENTLDVIWSMTPDLQIGYVNPAIEQQTGHTPEEFIGTTMAEHCTPENLARIKRVVQQEIELGQAGKGVMFQTELFRKDGSSVPVEAHGRVLFTDNDEPLNIQGTTRDISQRMVLEAQIRQSQKMESIGTIAGGIAHDFNNLLAIIIGNLELLKVKQKSGKPIEENLGHIKEASNRAKDLVAQILAFSRQEQKDFGPVNLTSFVGHSLKFLRPIIPTTVEIVTETPEGPVSINANTTQLQQVLINLCVNSIHAMNEKGLLQISLSEGELTGQEGPSTDEPQAARYAKLSVSDTGKGMDKKTLERIFDPFFTTKEVGLGTGMGLSVVYGISKQLGGFIKVDSTPGQGTTFTLYFPVTDDVEAMEETVTETTLPTGTESILFVDDEQSVAEASRSMLDHLGYKVTVMANGAEALDFFKAHPDDFDLIITDQTMPKMSGIELAKELLQIKPNIPIILCSGYSAQVTDEDALEVGIRIFCMKPVEMNQLATVAREALDMSNKPSNQG